MHFFFSWHYAFDRTVCQQSLSVKYGVVSHFYHACCRFLYLPHAGVKPPTARRSQNQIKCLKLFLSYVSNSPNLKLTALQEANKNYREPEQRCQLLQNPISHSPVIAKKLSLENLRGWGIKATIFNTKLKFMCFIKKKDNFCGCKEPYLLTWTRWTHAMLFP